MSKAKPKSQGTKTIRRLLIGAVCLMILICVATVVRFVLRPFFHVSKDIPYSQHYQLSGQTYLSSWSQEVGALSETRIDSIMLVNYKKTVASQERIAIIEFTYSDSGYFADSIYETRSAHSLYSSGYPHNFKVNASHANKFGAVCTTLFDNGPMKCSFVAQYGTCVIRVESPIIEPHITTDDYRQLIEDYIDPQMVAWSVCHEVSRL
jgi:hypothetical protein